jgi:hypothetical protein
VIALSFDVSLHELEQLSAIRLRSRAQVELGNCFARHDIRDLVSDSGRCHSAHVQGWILRGFTVIAADLLSLGDAETLAQRHFVVTGRGQCAAFRGSELDAVVVTRNQDTPAVILHRRQELREPHGGIRGVVAEMAAVEGRRGAKHRQRRLGDAAVAERERRPARLVRRAIEDHERIGGKQRGVRFHHAGEAG